MSKVQYFKLKDYTKRPSIDGAISFGIDANNKGRFYINDKGKDYLIGESIDDLNISRSLTLGEGSQVGASLIDTVAIGTGAKTLAKSGFNAGFNNLILPIEKDTRIQMSIYPCDSTGAILQNINGGDTTAYLKAVITDQTSLNIINNGANKDRKICIFLRYYNVDLTPTYTYPTFEIPINEDNIKDNLDPTGSKYIMLPLDAMRPVKALDSEDNPYFYIDFIYAGLYPSNFSSNGVTADPYTAAATLGYVNLAANKGAISAGYRNAAVNTAAIAMGYGNTSGGDSSVALGAANTVFGGRATAFGGENSIPKGCDYSLVSGFKNIVARRDQVVFGKYNKADANSIYVLGFGTGEEQRKNIHTVDQNGNAWFAGNLTTDKTEPASDNSLITKAFYEDRLESQLRSILDLRWEQITGKFISGSKLEATNKFSSITKTHCEYKEGFVPNNTLLGSYSNKMASPSETKVLLTSKLLSPINLTGSKGIGLWLNYKNNDSITVEYEDTTYHFEPVYTLADYEKSDYWSYRLNPNNTPGGLKEPQTWELRKGTPDAYIRDYDTIYISGTYHSNENCFFADGDRVIYIDTRITDRKILVLSLAQNYKVEVQTWEVEPSADGSNSTSDPVMIQDYSIANNGATITSNQNNGILVIDTAKYLAASVNYIRIKLSNSTANGTNGWGPALTSITCYRPNNVALLGEGQGLGQSDTILTLELTSSGTHDAAEELSWSFSTKPTGNQHALISGWNYYQLDTRHEHSDNNVLDGYLGYSARRDNPRPIDLTTTNFVRIYGQCGAPGTISVCQLAACGTYDTSSLALSTGFPIEVEDVTELDGDVIQAGQVYKDSTGLYLVTENGDL